MAYLLAETVTKLEVEQFPHPKLVYVDQHTRGSLWFCAIDNVGHDELYSLLIDVEHL
jgi:hypothetical protein